MNNHFKLTVALAPVEALCKSTVIKVVVAKLKVFKVVVPKSTEFKSVEPKSTVIPILV